MASLYDRLGGTPTVTVVVGRFLDKALADPRLQPHLRGVNLNRQRMQQMRFLSYALGATDVCPGGSPAAHFGPLMTDLGMDHEHLDLLLDYLGAALRDVGLPENIASEATGAVALLQDQFLGRTAVQD